MDFNFGMIQDLSQKQIMTQKLIQAINILRMDINELNKLIEEEYQENPTIEINKINIEEKQKINNNNNIFDDFDNKAIDDNKKNYIEITSNKNYIEELIEQWNCSKKDYLTSVVGIFIIHHINEKGYLDIEEKLIESIFNIDKEKTEEIIKEVHKLEPYGIGARNLRELLIIQL